jgi:hypothetical protein
MNRRCLAAARTRRVTTARSGRDARAPRAGRLTVAGEGLTPFGELARIKVNPKCEWTEMGEKGDGSLTAKSGAGPACDGKGTGLAKGSYLARPLRNRASQKREQTLRRAGIQRVPAPNNGCLLEV